MRAMFKVTASLAICVGLFGSDQSLEAQASVSMRVAAAAPVCNCPQLARAIAHTIKGHKHRLHRHRHGGNNAYHEVLWSDRESSASSYSSSDDSDYSSANDASGNGDAMAGAAIPPPPPNTPYPPSQAQSGVWVDGYGRGHYSEDAQESEGGDVADLTAKDTHRRLAPYHAYKVVCDKAE